MSWIDTARRWIGGPTLAERQRKNKNELNRTIRNLDRERVKLEQQEKKLVQDIKKSAKAGQTGALKIQANDLVRTRRHMNQFLVLRGQIQALYLRIEAMNTNEQMAKSMGTALGVLKQTNKKMNLPGLRNIIMEFDKQSTEMELKQEVMNDVIDDGMEGEDEEEPEEVIAQVLDEIGIDAKGMLGETPSGIQTNAVPESRVAQAVGGGGSTGDDDLQARLDSLRR